MNFFLIYIIWHNILSPNNVLPGFSDDDLKYVVFYGVNEAIAKSSLPPRFQSRVLWEWDLPIYDKKLQEKYYNEDSCMWHLYHNQRLIEGLDYIGFAQYDFVIGKSVINKIAHASQPTVFYMHNGGATELGRQGFYDLFLTLYNEFYGTDKQWRDIESIRCAPTFHAFVIPVSIFKSLMEFILFCYPRVYQDLVDRNQLSTGDWTTFSSIMERYHALWIGLSCQDMPFEKIAFYHTKYGCGGIEYRSRPSCGAYRR